MHWCRPEDVPVVLLETVLQHAISILCEFVFFVLQDRERDAGTTVQDPS